VRDGSLTCVLELGCGWRRGWRNPGQEAGSSLSLVPVQSCRRREGGKRGWTVVEEDVLDTGLYVLGWRMLLWSQPAGLVFKRSLKVRNAEDGMDQVVL